jgi:hypothetical protein
VIATDENFENVVEAVVLDSGTASYFFGGLLEGTHYYIQVRAIGPTGAASPWVPLSGIQPGGSLGNGAWTEPLVRNNQISVNGFVWSDGSDPSFGDSIVNTTYTWNGTYFDSGSTFRIVWANQRWEIQYNDTYYAFTSTPNHVDSTWEQDFSFFDEIGTVNYIT